MLLWILNLDLAAGDGPAAEQAHHQGWIRPWLPRTRGFACYLPPLFAAVLVIAHG